MAPHLYKLLASASPSQMAALTPQPPPAPYRLLQRILLPQVSSCHDTAGGAVHKPPLASAATEDQQPDTPRAEKPTEDAVDTEKAAEEEDPRWSRQTGGGICCGCGSSRPHLRRRLRRTPSRCAAFSAAGRSRRSKSHLAGLCVVIPVQFNTVLV